MGLPKTPNKPLVALGVPVSAEASSFILQVSPSQPPIAFALQLPIYSPENLKKVLTNLEGALAKALGKSKAQARKDIAKQLGVSEKTVNRMQGKEMRKAGDLSCKIAWGKLENWLPQIVTLYNLSGDIILKGLENS